MATLYRVREAARLINVTPTTIYTAATWGDIRPAVHPEADQTMLFDEKDLFRLRVMIEARREASVQNRDRKFRQVNRKAGGNLR